MSSDARTLHELQTANAELSLRLRELEDTIAAIQQGDVDALVVGNDIYTLESSNVAMNRLRQDVLTQMQDAVIACDADGHITFMNAAAERQYGQTASASLGRSRAELFVESWPDADRSASVQQLLAETGVYRGYSIHRKVADGVAIHVESTVSTLQNGDDRAGRLYVIRDVTGRVEADRSLHAATAALVRRERQFSTLVENSPDIFARFDRQHRHLYVSPSIESYTGLSAADYMGKSNAELGTPAELTEQLEQAVVRTFDSGLVQKIKFGVTNVAGAQRVLEARLIPEFDDSGAVESVLSIAVDVTEQEHANAALRASEAGLQDADRKKDEFLAMLAHELRNPLAPIRNALQIMRMTNDVATRDNVLGIIERQLNQMVHLVDDLLDVSRISQGKVALRLEVVDLAGAVKAAVETSRPLIDAGRHTLTVRLPPAGTVSVKADFTRLCQIVSNILNNAAKYTAEGGRIEVSAGRQGDQAVVVVEDSGVGISQDMLSHVFDMFAQGHPKLGNSQGGLGIGLALVKSLVELHHGSVEGHSDGSGHGSRFTVRLPLLAEPASPLAAAPAAKGPRLAPAQAAELRVLVVDDNVDNAETLAQLIEMLGYQTLTVYDGVDAVEAANTFQPQVVLLDIGLPRLNGHEAAKAIRSQPWGRDMLLVALSGWGQDEDKRKSLAAGFDHHLVKPVDLEPLMALLSDLQAPARSRAQGTAA